MNALTIKVAALSAIVISSFCGSDADAGCFRRYTPTYTKSTTVVVNTIAVKPVVPVVVQPAVIKRISVPSGSTLTLKANFLQDEPGQAVLFIEGLAMQCEIQAWSNTQVTVKMPTVGLAGSHHATLKLFKPDGSVGKSYNMLVNQPSDVIVHEEVITIN